MRFKFWALLTGTLFLLNTNGQSNFLDQSVLKSGKWYRFKIDKTGIYKITYEDLISLGFETPQNIRIYGNGGGQLPLSNDSLVKDDLQELAIYPSNKSGFTEGDFYLFYAEGPTSWRYDDEKGMFIHHLHDYSETNYYYLTTSFGAGKRIEKKDNSYISENKSTNEYDFRDYHENELKNLLGSGLKLGSGSRWFGEKFSENPVTVNVKTNELASSNVELFSAVAVRSGESKIVTVQANSEQIDTFNHKPVNLTDSEYKYADIEEKKVEFSTSVTDLNFTYKLQTPQVGELAYLDFIFVNARCKLSINSPEFYFRDINLVEKGKSARYSISNANSAIRIWNITDHNNVFEINSSIAGAELSFKDSVSFLNEYVAVDVTNNFGKPVFVDEEFNDVGWINNQNLHAMEVPELLIVTHPVFILQAEELAKLHREKDAMKVAVVTTEQVYNEFSSGKPDAVAIRNLSRMLYERSTVEAPYKYLLLFGDGSFDNRTRDPNNPNYVPIFESYESVNPISSYSTDDVYGMLDPGEWSVNGDIDIGIGRIPVKSTENQREAQGVVDKIKLYYEPSVMKDWRNRMIFLGDDGESGWDNKQFMVNSDTLTKVVERKVPSINVTKIYLDAFPQISSSTGASYPEVEDALNVAFKKGALVFNYIGHGGESGITQEKVLQKSDIKGLTNAPHFPLFMTATCQMSRFDNVIIEESGEFISRVSAGEEALLNPNGGAIGLITTTRLVYESENFRLSQNIYRNLFEKDADGKRYRLGDVLRLAKNNIKGSINEFKYVLLGDPAITLAYGEYKVITDSINGTSSTIQTDTVNALENIIVSGFVAYDDSTIINDFNGVVTLNVFDKKYMVTTRGNDNIPVFDFTMQDRMLFRGNATVKNGRFSAEFKIPKDISYSFGEGKISYYAQNGVVDAKGHFSNFIIGGSSEIIEEDMEGPEVELYMNNESFEDGGITDANPVLIANVYDENGINTTGSGIGHDIMGVLDPETGSPINYLLNDFYEGELDDYRSGKIQYPLSDVTEGQHDISVKVWDTYNNSTEKTLGFFVKGGDKIFIEKVFSYPNPMSDHTNFQYHHNMPGKHEVHLEIFDLTGKLIYIYNVVNEEQGFVSEPITWERNSGNGVIIAPGVYPYKLKVRVKNNLNEREFIGSENGRLIIIP